MTGPHEIKSPFPMKRMIIAFWIVSGFALLLLGGFLLFNGLRLGYLMLLPAFIMAMGGAIGPMVLRFFLLLVCIPEVGLKCSLVLKIFTSN